MEANEARRQQIAEVARTLGSAIRRRARGRWAAVRTAERNVGGRHVWRFRPAADADERFLHIEHRDMVRGSDPAARLLARLESQGWLDRLHEGPHAALLLARDGQLVALPA